jgi:predicted transposase YbfD/YdcC
MHLKQTLFDHFSSIPDPRVTRTRRHLLIDIIVITICAILCGADSWIEVALFGRCKQSWFKTFLTLPNGIPSHDTFGRVFALLDAQAFEQGFENWVTNIALLTGGDVVAIDGKTLRRSHANKDGMGALHLVSAFATRNGLSLGERKIDTKSNELKAIPKLIQILNLSGCTVTIDAAGCYKEVVQTLLNKGSNYVIAVKENQPNLLFDIRELFLHIGMFTHDYTEEFDASHGREVTRFCEVISEPEAFHKVRHAKEWGLGCVAKITNIRKTKKRVTHETRYYISSLTNTSAKELLQIIRAHWKIENSLHWVLDIAYREDESRIRNGYAGQNFALMRKITFNLLKQEQTVKAGIKAKRLNAGWDHSYLLGVLGIKMR